MSEQIPEACGYCTQECSDCRHEREKFELRQQLTAAQAELRGWIAANSRGGWIDELRNRAEAAERRAAELEGDLLRATSIGIATIFARVGAYESLSPYMRGKWDKLQSMRAKCEAAFRRNQVAARRGR